MTVRELYNSTVASLSAPLGEGEAKATARLLFEDVLKLSLTGILTRGDREVEPEIERIFAKYTARIAAGEPPQYVVGTARFMGMDFKVTRDTLIPRPETAQLVDLVTDYARGMSDLRIIDVGTGSGCIAIALQRALPFASVTAVDISLAALEVARQNVENLKARIELRRADILTTRMPQADIVVSNPPYIAESERSDMETRVSGHEPSSALFVPDSDPLVFYRAIIDNCPAKAYFFEINPLFANEMASLISSRGMQCDILLDSFGKKRFAVAKN